MLLDAGGGGRNRLQDKHKTSTNDSHNRTQFCRKTRYRDPKQGVQIEVPNRGRNFPTDGLIMIIAGVAAPGLETLNEFWS